MTREGGFVSSRPVRSDPAGSLSALDAGFLYLDRPNAPLQIGALLRVDGLGLGPAVLSLLAERLPRLPRFAQRPSVVRRWFRHPDWEWAPDFDPREHVYTWSVPTSHGGPMTCPTLHRILAEPLPPERPLWDLHLFEDEGLHTTAVLFRAHHSMLDGMGGLACLDQLLDDENDTSESRGLSGVRGDRFGPPHPLGPSPSGNLAPLGSRGASLVRNLQRPRTIAARAWGALSGAHDLLRGDVPKHAWNCRLSRRRQLASTTVPLDRIRAIRRGSNCRFNDVVLCMVGGGLARYLRRTGADVSRPMQLLVPVNRRSGAGGSEPTGNRIAALRVSLPVDGLDEERRLRCIQGVTAPLMSRRAWEQSETWLSVANAVPAAVLAPAARAIRVGRFANLVVTNLMGSAHKRTLGGRPVHEIRPIVPIYHDLGLGVAAMSYAGQLSLTLQADPTRVGDLDRLAADTAQAGEALYRQTVACA